MMLANKQTRKGPHHFTTVAFICTLYDKSILMVTRPVAAIEAINPSLYFYRAFLWVTIGYTIYYWVAVWLNIDRGLVTNCDWMLINTTGATLLKKSTPCFVRNLPNGMVTYLGKQIVHNTTGSPTINNDFLPLTKKLQTCRQHWLNRIKIMFLDLTRWLMPFIWQNCQLEGVGSRECISHTFL